MSYSIVIGEEFFDHSDVANVANKLGHQLNLNGTEEFYDVEDAIDGLNIVSGVTGLNDIDIHYDVDAGATFPASRVPFNGKPICSWLVIGFSVDMDEVQPYCISDNIDLLNLLLAEVQKTWQDAKIYFINTY